MKISSVLSFIMMFGVSGAVSAGPALSPETQSLVKQLKARKYFKTATCSYVTNYFLRSNHLPEIGKSIADVPLKFRGNLDRSGESDSSPRLEDGFVFPDGSPRIRIKAEPVDPTHWNLHSQVYFQPKNYVKASFKFARKPARAMTACELQEIEIEANPGLGKPDVRVLSFEDCLRQMLHPDKDSWSNRREFHYLRTACKMGLQFFDLKALR